MIINGRVIFSGQTEGEVLVSEMGISFYGGVDPDTGMITEAGHDLEGELIASKILVFPAGKGSTVGSYILYRLKHNGCAPAAIINAECETIIAVGSIIAEIPCVDQVEICHFKTGMMVALDGEKIFIKQKLVNKNNF